MGREMVTFDRSSWTDKNQAFYQWKLDDLASAVLRHPLTAEHAVRFYEADVRDIKYGPSLQLLAQSAQGERSSEHGSYDLILPRELSDEDMRRAMVKLCGHAFYRAGFKYDEMMSATVTSALYSDEDGRFRRFVRKTLDSIPGQLELFSADTPALPVASAIVETPRKRMVRGFEVIEGRRGILDSPRYHF